jgi:cyclopropane-fatty-acyl-phospholipid synthase
MGNIFSGLRPRGQLDDAIDSRPLLERMLIRWLGEIEQGTLAVDLPSGVQETFGAHDKAPRALLTINELKTILRVGLSGDLGLAEGYMAQEWDTPDLSALLTLGAVNADHMAGHLSANPVTTWLNRIIHARRANTRHGSRRNIAAHYDLGNDFYRLWLDETMTYSSGVFSKNSHSLADAQREKYLRIAELLELAPDKRVLEIGCGWGGFAEIAAGEFGCEVVGLTLSEEQAIFARKRMAAAGLDPYVDIRILDYRDVDERFDAIASIEMFEAVGQENWPCYFEALDRCLTPTGRAALQVITIANEKFDYYRRNPDFIQRYIFPGGMLPSPQLFDETASDGGFKVADRFYFGASYAETLRRWSESFNANWPAIKRLGFDERFRRMWHYYLCYCEVGFDTGQIDVGQFLLERS